MIYKQGYTYRTKCGKGRATYDPAWSPSLPWCLFVNGTAIVNKGSLEAAKQTLKEYGCDVRESFPDSRPCSKSVIENEAAVWNGEIQ